jgi:PAS domain S-box-containing protein
MNQTHLKNLFLDQSKDLFWIIDLDFQLIYANKSYLSFMREVSGEEKKLNESIFTGVIDEGYIETWKAYYSKALNGEHFEVEEHSYHQDSDQLRYTQVTFEPLTGEDDKIFAVACQSKDITRVVKEKSEENQLIDSSLDVFCTVNEQGNFVYVSAASINHWGYLPEELIGKSYKDLILEEDLPKTNGVIESIHSSPGIKSFVNRYKKKDGSIAYNIWSARWDDRSKLRYAVARDGKEKIEQEEALLLSEQRYKALVQDGSDLIRILDTEGNFIYVSPTSTSILGIAPEEFMGKNIFDYIHPDDVAKALKCLQKITTEKKIIVAPFRFQNHKKEWRWMESVLTNMLDNPAVNGIVVNSRDVTAKIEKEHQLKLFESVITKTNEAVLITDAEPFEGVRQRIIYVNEAFTKMTGYSAEEIIGKSPRILQGPNSNSEELSRLNTAIRNWESCEITTLNYKKNGEEFWINLAVTPVTNEEGRNTHWIAIVRDVTSQKTNELEKELIAQISINFNTEDDLTFASTELCKSISQLGDFDLVELWTTNLDKSQIQLLSHYVADPDDEKFFEDSSEFISYSKSEGLPGIVWSKKKQLLWDDVENIKQFKRRDSAKKIGLKSVIGIPLFSNDEVIGILNIGSKHGASRINNYTQVFKKLEGFIGSEVNRKKLENDLSHFFNAIPDIICVMDFQGKFLKINKAGCDLLGYSEEKILYHNFEEFAHQDDKGVFINEVKGLQKEENTFGFENRYITHSGNIVWLSWYCNSSLRDGLVYATAKNITEEKKLRELNRQAGSLAKIGSWELDLMNQSVFWSDEIHQMHETDPKSFFPDLKEAINFYRADFHSLVNKSIENCISKGEPFDFESVLVTTKKKELWVRTIGKGEFVDGECIRIYGSFQDINDRKEAEVRLQSLADNLPGVVFQYIFYTDGTDSLKYVSKGAQDIWGFSAEEVLQNIQLIWDRIALGGELKKLKKSITDCIESKTKWTATWKYVMPNGEIRTHLGRASPAFLADGTVVLNSVILDVTKEAANEVLLEQYTNELERSNEELEQFAFVASHDLQEPLRMISSFMDLLERKYGHLIDEKGHQYIHYATDGAKRMRRIILDLLDYSRASKTIEEKEDVDINELLSEFRQLRRKIISEKSASITCKGLPKLKTDKVAIIQILHCLLDNALTYSQEGTPPMIEINAVENKKEWEFSIKDNGIGIEPQFYDKIFVIFQRLHNKNEYEGTGIGLSIAKKHVEILGGRIWLESKLGEGTTFYFTIPKTN